MDERKVSKARMSLVTSGCPRILAPSSNAPCGKMALVLLLSQTSRTRSPRALAPRNVDGTSPPDQRWASADLSPGFSIQIQAWPVLQTRPRSRSELRRRIDNVSSREVSKDGGSTARRRPNLSITFSFLRVDRRFEVQAASLTFARFENQHASRATVSTHRTFLRSLRFSLSFCSLPHTSSLSTDCSFPNCQN